MINIRWTWGMRFRLIRILQWVTSTTLLILIRWLFLSMFFSLILDGDLPYLFIIENRLIQLSCIPTLIIKIEISDHNSIRSYSKVTIGLFMWCLLGPTSSWVVSSAWSLIFNRPSVRVKIEMSLLTLESIIKPGELWFSIGLSPDWQSQIGPLCSNQVDQFHLRYNSCFIFLFGILLHWYHRVGDVFNMKRSSYDFNFCLLYSGISSVGYWAFFKKPFTSCFD
jgi:hypothetical protein